MKTVFRRGSAITAVSALAGGVLMVAGGATASADPEIKNVGFTTACHVREMDGAASPITFNETLGSGVTVTAPATATPGETFTYRLQPKEMKANSGGHASRGVVHWARIKYDFDIPAGVEFVKSELVVNSAYGLGSDSATPTVTRIDDSGNLSATGTHLRISGLNRTTGNGPESAVRSSDGIIVGANTTFRLPAIDVTVKAGAAGTEIKPSVRVSDSGSANYDNDKNALTFVQREKDVFGVNYWERYNCSPRDNKSSGLNAGGQALTTIYVSQPTTTTMQMPASIQASTPTELVANVGPAPVSGNVQFRINGSDIGSPVAPGVDGVARLPYTFYTAGTAQVSAAFQGVNGFLSSSSTESTVTVTAAPVVKQTDTIVTVPGDAKTGTSVTLKAQVSPLPTAGTLQFKDGAANIGDPVTVSADGSATYEHVFTSAGTHAVSAYYSGATGFMPSMAPAQSVIVSDPAPSDVATSASLTVPASAKQSAAVELSVTIAPNPGGGSVQFFDGDQLIGGSVVVGADGVARMAHTFTSIGDHRIKAVFNGRAGFTQSTSDESVVSVSATPGDGGNGGTGSLGSLGGLFGS
ncbi:Ig-like domain-containing protein [Rhodococcus sp. IEGM 1379]|uniref:Ig-like domain-containing protein n=1 Tax=Rhodococcus sp. IEGM 1379 TaxID=3047086 RepID=UPI0024B85C87|nr:Ig-like domain-containing protein [Rhodococcus sp. IEGM 1379]MDI9914566.1 Ig-like domain-containing protein [Rhodococcus sp. IEGM 1379]